MIKKAERICKNCGGKFNILEAYLKYRIKKGEKSNGTFCCLGCMHEYRKNNCYKIGKCKICGKKFRYKKSAYSGNYCSKRCAELSHSKPESWEIRKCIKCGKEFKTKVYKKQKHCSQKCSGRARVNRIKKKCEWCGNEYELRESKENKSRFCSHECLNKWLHSDKEVLRKRMQSLKERFRNKENHPLFGKNHTKKTKDKMSKTRRIKKLSAMENNPNWQGGKSFEPYTSDFNNELRAWIRERDNYQCQICGLKQNGRKLSVHHIDYDKSDNRRKNLITLCVSHHSATNKDRDKWQFFFESYQEIRLMGVN